MLAPDFNNKAGKAVRCGQIMVMQSRKCEDCWMVVEAFRDGSKKRPHLLYSVIADEMSPEDANAFALRLRNGFGFNTPAKQV